MLGLGIGMPVLMRLLIDDCALDTTTDSDGGIMCVIDQHGGLQYWIIFIMISYLTTAIPSNYRTKVGVGGILGAFVIQLFIGKAAGHDPEDPDTRSPVEVALTSQKLQEKIDALTAGESEEVKLRAELAKTQAVQKKRLGE